PPARRGRKTGPLRLARLARARGRPRRHVRIDSGGPQRNHPQSADTCNYLLNTLTRIKWRIPMDKLDEISRIRKKSHQKFLSLKSKVYDAFLQMEQATYKDGALPKKTKELIAIGISVQMNCESCMQWHIDQAAACGATMHEILEAVEVGIEMGAGRVTVSARFALDVIERAFPNEKF